MGKQIWNQSNNQLRSKSDYYNHPQHMHDNNNDHTGQLDNDMIDTERVLNCHMKRRYNRKAHHQQHDSRLAANLRERKRMQSINHAFEDLRTLVPALPYEKRLSKVNTLRLAISYIGFMSDLLTTDDPSKPNCRQNLIADKPNKVILHHSAYDDEFDGYGFSPFLGHSLSWCTEDASIDSGDEISNSITKSAKVWIPEDPRSL